MTDYSDALKAQIIHKIIVQTGSDGVKYLIDEISGRYIKLIGDTPVASGKFSSGYLSMAANRVAMGSKGFSTELMNNEIFEKFFYDLYEELKR